MSNQVKVLIADDNPDMRITLRHILSDFDCDITEVGTGEDAFEKISAEYFNVVFFDNKLPKADGLEIIKQVRELNKAVGKIFLLTGYPEEDTKVEANRLGVFHFQNKKDMALAGAFLAEIRKKFREALSS
ncbi:MAG TPA: response regulator [Pyrinomonadaceae bacterium]|nr:response regulator [Pyrinomonadaceae bacterium]